MKTGQESWVIAAQKPGLDLKLKELWAYRDLLMLLVQRDFISFYKQTILGPLWFFIQPLLTTITFTLIFGHLAKLPTDGLPQSLFYMTGITLWNYFSECFTKTATAFKDNAAVFGKVYFPRLLAPLSTVISNLIRFGIQLFLLLICMGFYWCNGGEFQIGPIAMLFPVLILFTALQGLGLGLIVAALTTKYRDILFLLGFAIQLLMYSTTVIYPLSAAPEHLRWIITINPMTTMIEAFRYGLLGKGSFTLGMLGYTAGFTMTMLLTGLIAFNKAEKNFIDII